MTCSCQFWWVRENASVLKPHLSLDELLVEYQLFIQQSLPTDVLSLGGCYLEYDNKWIRRRGKKRDRNLCHICM